MKESLESANWKKIAGDMLTNDFANKSEAKLYDAQDKMRLKDVSICLTPNSR